MNRQARRLEIFEYDPNHVPRDLPHGWVSYRVAWDNGAMDGVLWAEYRQASSYYGKGIAQPTPNPNLVKVVKRKRTTDSEPKAIFSDGEFLSPSGFADSEDDDAPWVGDANEQLAAPEPLASGTPNLW